MRCGEGVRSVPSGGSTSPVPPPSGWRAPDSTSPRSSRRYARRCSSRRAREDPPVYHLRRTRRALGVDGEATWKVPPLAMPDPRHRAAPGRIEQFRGLPAVRRPRGPGPPELRGHQQHRPTGGGDLRPPRRDPARDRASRRPYQGSDAPTDPRWAGAPVPAPDRAARCRASRRRGRSMATTTTSVRWRNGTSSGRPAWRCSPMPPATVFVSCLAEIRRQRTGLQEEALPLVYLARAHLALGRAAEARACALEATEIAERSRARVIEAQAWCTWARVLRETAGGPADLVEACGRSRPGPRRQPTPGQLSTLLFSRRNGRGSAPVSSLYAWTATTRSEPPGTPGGCAGNSREGPSAGGECPTSRFPDRPIGQGGLRSR